MSEDTFERILMQQAQQVGNQLLGELEDIRKQHGEDAYKQAVSDAVQTLKTQGPRGEDLAKLLFKDIDFSTLPPPQISQEQIADVEEASKRAAPPPDLNMAKAIMDQIPGLDNQAKFNVTMAAFDALRLLLGTIFTGDREGAVRAHKALEGAVEAARQAALITEKLRDVPEAVKDGAEFRKPPVELTEFDTMKALVAELEGIVTIDAFNEWYKANRKRMDDVKSQSLRNTLFDAIRERQGKLAKENASPS